MIKTVDICLPPAKTELEQWSRWMNRIQTELRTLSYYKKVKIEVFAPDEVCGFRGERFIHADLCHCDEDYQEAKDSGAFDENIR